MGIKILSEYDPQERLLPSEEEAKCRKEHPEWYIDAPPLTPKQKRDMDSVGALTGTRSAPSRAIEVKDTPSRFPVRQIKGDLENERPPARPDPSPFKLGR